MLHAAELVGLVGGFFWFADLRRRGVLVPLAAWGVLLLFVGASLIWRVGRVSAR